MTAPRESQRKKDLIAVMRRDSVFGLQGTLRSVCSQVRKLFRSLVLT